jgi:hypothetical protein
MGCSKHCAAARRSRCRVIPYRRVRPIGASSARSQYVINPTTEDSTYGKEKQRWQNDRRQETGRQVTRGQRPDQESSSRPEDHENLASATGFTQFPKAVSRRPFLFSARGRTAAGCQLNSSRLHNNNFLPPALLPCIRLSLCPEHPIAGRSFARYAPVSVRKRPAANPPAGPPSLPMWHPSIVNKAIPYEKQKSLRGPDTRGPA